MGTNENTDHTTISGLAFLSTGICSGCEVCANDQDQTVKSEEFADKVSNGEICSEPSFSQQSCELCGSELGGDRYAAHGRDQADNIIHLEICVDCVQVIYSTNNEWRTDR